MYLPRVQTCLHVCIRLTNPEVPWNIYVCLHDVPSQKPPESIYSQRIRVRLASTATTQLNTYFKHYSIVFDARANLTDFCVCRACKNTVSFRAPENSKYV